MGIKRYAAAAGAVLFTIALVPATAAQANENMRWVDRSTAWSWAPDKMDCGGTTDSGACRYSWAGSGNWTVKTGRASLTAPAGCTQIRVQARMEGAVKKASFKVRQAGVTDVLGRGTVDTVQKKMTTLFTAKIAKTGKLTLRVSVDRGDYNLTTVEWRTSLYCPR